MNFKFILVLMIVLSVTYSKAQNPIIQTKFTADPAPMVYHDTVFLYADHDEDDAFTKNKSSSFKNCF